MNLQMHFQIGTEHVSHDHKVVLHSVYGQPAEYVFIWFDISR